MKVFSFILLIISVTFSFSQNPLAQHEDLFSGNYTGEAFNLNLEKTAEGYTGNIDFDGQIFPVYTQASDTSLTGYFISGNDHFEIAAKLNGINLSFTTGGANYTLTKVAITQNQNTQTPIQTTSQANVVITQNQQYPAGTRLQSPWTGVSFVVPENHTAYFDADFGGFLMLTQDGNSLITVEASSQASAEELGIFAIEALAEYLLEGEANYQVVGQPSFEADLLKAQVLIGEAMISVIAKEATTKNAAVVLAYGPQAEQLVQTVVDGITLTQPSNDVANWEQKMYGMHASTSSSSSDYSDDGVPGRMTGSYAGQAKFNYDFCSDGNYRHEYNDIAYFSTGTTGGEMIGSVQTGSEGAHQGSWHLVSSLMGNLLLILESTEGNTYIHPIAESETGAYINNRNYTVSQSQLCR